MNNLKKWDEIELYSHMYYKKEELIKKFVYNFYQSVKTFENVMSGEEVYELCDKFSLFNKSFWYKNRDCFKEEYRKSNPVIFALKSGIAFQDNYVHLFGNNIHGYIEFEGILKSEIILKIEGNKIIDISYPYLREIFEYNQEDINIFKDFLNQLFEMKNKFDSDIEDEIKRCNQQLRLEKEEFYNNKANILLYFDKNEDGNIDLIENDFNTLFSKNQKKVSEIDKNYIHQFVKISNYIKTKKQNIQIIFESIKDANSIQVLEERNNFLENQIHLYDILIFHSINMIGALVSDDFVTFYEIYESFDKIGMFNSNWENEVSGKLTNIGDQLNDLIYSINKMEQNIVSELSNLSYVTQEAFVNLNLSVSNQLKEVKSSIDTNNLLTGIQTYQMYKINENTRQLKS